MDFLPVRLSTLKAETPINFNIYIKLTHRYLLYVKNGGEMAASQFDNLKNKKVRKLFIDSKDESNYQVFLDAGLSAIVDNKVISASDKALVAKDMATDTAEILFNEPATKAAYDAVCKTSKNLFKLISGNNGVLKEILTKDCADDGNIFLSKLQNHAVNCTSLALKFGEYLGIDTRDLEILGIAAMYHDIGLTAISKEGFDLAFSELEGISPSALSHYYSHPQKGCELLQDKEFASKEVLDLIITHEERVDGTGFPNKLNKLSILQEIHAICCYYDREVTLLNKASAEVISNMIIESVGKFNLETLNKFKAFLKKVLAV